MNITLEKMKADPRFSTLEWTAKNAAEWLKVRNLGKVRFKILMDAGLVIGETEEDKKRALLKEFQHSREAMRSKLALLNRRIARYTVWLQTWKNQRDKLAAFLEEEAKFHLTNPLE